MGCSFTSDVFAHSVHFYLPPLLILVTINMSFICPRPLIHSLTHSLSSLSFSASLVFYPVNVHAHQISLSISPTSHAHPSPRSLILLSFSHSLKIFTSQQISPFVHSLPLYFYIYYFF